MQGEAQKIDKIMEIFALEYFKHNKENGSVKSEDAAYILSFAIMMLHTALHNPSVKHKTTKREWVSMNRGERERERERERESRERELSEWVYVCVQVLLL